MSIMDKESTSVKKKNSKRYKFKRQKQVNLVLQGLLLMHINNSTTDCPSVTYKRYKHIMYFC